MGMEYVTKTGKNCHMYCPLSSGEVRIGELIKERLSEVGIDVQVKSLESKSRDTNLKNGDFELLISGFGGWGQMQIIFVQDTVIQVHSQEVSHLEQQYTVTTMIP